MKKVEFAIYDAPSKSKQAACARLVSSGTKNMHEVCEYINECCSVNSSDIKGVLTALSNYIGSQLSRGYSVELEGLGYFSAALKTQKIKSEENGKTTYNVSVDGVNFRCAPELKEKVKDCTPQKVKRENEKTANQEERKAVMLEFLKIHPVINVSDYAAINQCTYYTAKNDIALFEKQNIIESEGYKTHRVYKLTEKKEEDSESSSTPSKPIPERVRIAGKIKI